MSIVRVIGQRGNFEATPYFSTFGYYTGNNENISQGSRQKKKLHILRTCPN